MGVDRLHSLPICERGYVLEHLNLRKVKCTDIMVWHGKHKPYCCDFPTELIEKKGDKNEQRSK